MPQSQSLPLLSAEHFSVPPIGQTVPEAPGRGLPTKLIAPGTEQGGES